VASEVDLTPVLNAVRGINVQVDLGPVLDAVRKIKVVDDEQVARSMDERIRRHGFATRGDLEQVLQAVRQVNQSQPREVDLRPVLDAIGRVSLKVDHAPVLKAIDGLEFRVDHTPVLEAINGVAFCMDQAPVLEAIRRVGCVPTAEAIAALVHDRIRQTQLSVVTPEVDFSTVRASLNGLTDTNAQILRGLAELRSDIWSLRCRAEKPPQVVQPVIQQSPIMQATTVVPAANALVPTTTAVVPATTSVVPATTSLVPATTSVVPATTSVVPAATSFVRAEMAIPWTPRQQAVASSQMTIICPHCGNHYMDDSNFCRKCGTPRGSATPGVKRDLTPRVIGDYVVPQRQQTLIQTQGSVKAPVSVTCGDVVQSVESYVVDGFEATRTPRKMRSLSRGTSPCVMDRLQSASQELTQTRQSLAEQRTASRPRFALSLSQSGLVLNQPKDAKLGSE